MAALRNDTLQSISKVAVTFWGGPANSNPLKYQAVTIVACWLSYIPSAIQTLVARENAERPNTLTVAYDTKTSEQANASSDNVDDPFVLFATT